MFEELNRISHKGRQVLWVLVVVGGQQEPRDVRPVRPDPGEPVRAAAPHQVHPRGLLRPRAQVRLPRLLQGVHHRRSPQDALPGVMFFCVLGKNE